MSFRNTLLVILFVISSSFGEYKNPEFYQDRYRSAKIGLAMRFTGIGLSALSIPMASGDNWRPWSAAGRITRYSGDLVAGVAATRSLNEYRYAFKGDSRFKWSKYGVGCGLTLVGWSMLARNGMYVDDVQGLIGLSSLLAGEILFTIHTVKALKATRRVAKKVTEKTLALQVGLAPVVGKDLCGLTMLIQF